MLGTARAVVTKAAAAAAVAAYGRGGGHTEGITCDHTAAHLEYGGQAASTLDY